MGPFRSVAFALGCIIAAQTSVSTPRTPPTAFHSGAHWRFAVPRRCQQHAGRRSFCSSGSRGPSSSLSLSKSDASFFDRIAQALGIDQSVKQNDAQLSIASETNDRERGQGKVVRTAARPQQPSGGSIPSSRHYTTRKPSLPMIAVSDAGVAGDYNHYRTVALKSTANRAISILTRDVSSYIQTLDGGFFAKEGGYTDGDLGENVLVEGVAFDFFRVGQRYRFATGKGNGGDAGNAMEGVIVEITEPMEPCANLCKLPYINDPSLSSPKERVARCQYFLQALGQRDGLRGWYARVLQGGAIHVGDSLLALGAVA